MTYDIDPAYPTTSPLSVKADGTLLDIHGYGPHPYPGLTKLEWFAGKALEGICAGVFARRDVCDMDYRLMALNAWSLAKAMVEYSPK